MKIIKKGILFDCKFYPDELLHSAIQPTALITGENTAKVYCGARNQDGVSTIYAVDIIKDGDNLKVLKVSDGPVLNIGLPGTFDDNGVVPSAVVRREEGIYMYYAGYQLSNNVRFLVLGGVAVSNDDGVTFTRIKNTPVLERTDKEFLFRVAHTVLFEKGKWRVWYGGGNHFEKTADKTVPVYDIRYMESDDGINFPNEGSIVLPNAGNEYRVGRPYVIKKSGKYFMFFGASTNDVPYRLTYATSTDGHTWERHDIGITYEEGEFDSNMSAYPCIIELENKSFMLYNGNDYGKQGFGYAEINF